MLTFENSPVQGAAGITEKLVVCFANPGHWLHKGETKQSHRLCLSRRSSTRSPAWTPSPPTTPVVSWSLLPEDFLYVDCRLRSHTLKADHLTSQVDEEQRPMSYTQSFQLLPDGAGSYYVFNDIFRLVYAAA